MSVRLTNAAREAIDLARSRAVAPPAAPKPTNIGRRRAGRAWTVHCGPVGQPTGAPSGGAYAPAAASVLPDKIVCWWTGTSGILACTEQTWRFIEQDDNAITAMQETQEAAKAAMPHAVVTDVVLAARGRATVTRQQHDPRNPQPAVVGIELVRAKAQALVMEMARFTEPDIAQQAEFARRYGKLRDEMARLRQEFTEAEGAFEVIQARIIDFME